MEKDGRGQIMVEAEGEGLRTAVGDKWLIKKEVEAGEG